MAWQLSTWQLFDMAAAFLAASFFGMAAPFLAAFSDETSFQEGSIFSPLGASTSVPKLMAAIGGFFSITRLLASFSRSTSCLRDRIDHYRDRIHPHSSWPGRNGSFFGPPSRVAAGPLVGRFATQQSGPLAAPLSGRQCCSSSPLVTVNPAIPGL